MDIYSSIAKMCLWFYQTLTFQRRYVSGREQLPAGAKIVAANHPNPTDGYHFPFVLDGKFYALINGTSFSWPLVGWLMTRCGQIPVHKDQKHKALDQACELLKQGQTVLIFPEGRLNPDHLPLKADTGAVRMSLISGAPIVPVGIYVPEHYLHARYVHYEGRVDKRRYQVGGCCYIQIGEPWYPAREAGLQRRSYTPRELTAILMEKIDQLAYQARQQANLQEGLNTQHYLSRQSNPFSHTPE
jgi:1-acyl-sn-glycerol-3-phosphate acyltransferase